MSRTSTSKHGAIEPAAELAEVNLIDHSAIVRVQVGGIGGVASGRIERRPERAEVHLVDDPVAGGVAEEADVLVTPLS